MVQNVYGVPPPPPEEHHKGSDYLNTIVQGMQTHIYELEVLAQANEVLTSSNSSVMVQLAHITVTINTVQAQLKTLSWATKNPTRTKKKFYCRICRSNFTHGIKSFSSKITG